MMKIIITVDTEADNQWKRDDLSIENVKFLKRFHELCCKFKYKPTYLVTYEIARDAQTISLLKKWHDTGEAEVGAHLHPWSTPPFSTKDTVKRFPSNLDDFEIKEKLISLTEIIRCGIGVSPTSYRSGRWGFDARQAECLVGLGYTVDCSLTPLINWRSSGGPDWSTILPFPHIVNTPIGMLLEIPMTVLPGGLLVNVRSKFIKMILSRQGWFWDLCKKIMIRPHWFRIFKETQYNDLVNLYKSAVKNNLPYFEFMIHSSELMPGGSPYFKTEQDVEKLYALLDKFFNFLQGQGVVGVTLIEASKDYYSKQ